MIERNKILIVTHKSITFIKRPLDASKRTAFTVPKEAQISGEILHAVQQEFILL